MISIPFEALLLTSGVGALQSAFFGLYLFTAGKRRSLTNLLLAVLLLVFAVRIGKSLVYFFADNHDVPAVIMNMGFGANLAIFPLLLLYLKAFFNTTYRFDWRRHGVHFVVPAVVIALSGVIPAHFWMQQGGYALSLWSGLVYLPFCVYAIVKNFTSLTAAQRAWILILTFGVAVVWMGYFANFILGAVSYITAPVSFSVFNYLLTYIGLKKPEIFTPKIAKERYQQSAYSDERVDKCFADWRTLLATTSLHKDATLTLPTAAARLNANTNLLSETINRKTGQTFPDHINSLRIRDAQLLLKDPTCNLKVAAIAYEVGFSSVSVFNAAFKKHAGTTPSDFRRQQAATQR